MRCASPSCPNPRKGLRYVVAGVEVCTACAELTRAGKLVTLDDFVHLDPRWQSEIGTVRQTLQEVLGHFDRYRDEGVQFVRSG